MSDAIELISMNINYFLNKQNKTQADLARYVKTNDSTVSHWCKGIRYPTAIYTKRIAKFFNIDIYELFVDRTKTTQVEMTKRELFGTTDVPDEILNKVKEYAKFVYDKKE